MASVIRDVPKPMAPIGEHPFLEFLVNQFKNYDLKKFKFLTGYKAESIQDYFNDGSSLNVTAEYSHEDSPLGTGGALKKALLDSDDSVCILINGDTIFNFDIDKFIEESNGQNAIALRHCEDLSRYGRVVIGDDKVISDFREKDASDKTPGYINGGTYLLNRSIVEKIPDGFVSLESDVFPVLASSGELKGIPVEGEFIDIGIPEDYESAQELLPKWIPLNQG